MVSEETSVDKAFRSLIRNPGLSLENWGLQIFAYDGSEAPVFATDEEGTFALKFVKIFREMTRHRRDEDELPSPLSPSG